MTQVLLLHSVLGLRPAVLALAERLRVGGHAVSAPDLLDGRVFDDYDEALAFSRDHEAEIADRATGAYAALTGPRVVAGFSSGAGRAQEFALRDPQVRGAILIAGGGYWEGLMPATWRPDVPVAFHEAIDDPWDEAPQRAALIGLIARSGADVTDHVYPGAGHLFFDGGLPTEYSAANTELLVNRMLGFLGRFG